MMRQFVTVAKASDACVADADTLCIDDQPGDHRFKIEVRYQSSRNGGIAGHARAIPLTSLGVNQGGLFWFFSADNPELLIKVLNGCGLGGYYWVFYSAGTDLGITVTVTDTVTGRVFTRTSPDGKPVPTVQSTSALPCNP
jgi:hypothetical protein